jgi:hypothetical protein
MTVSAAVSTFLATSTTASGRVHPRRGDGFDRQLPSSAGRQATQASAGTGVSGHLLSSDLLRQLQALPGIAAASPTGR